MWTVALRCWLLLTVDVIPTVRHEALGQALGVETAGFAVLQNATDAAVLCCLQPPALSARVRPRLDCAARCAQLATGCSCFNLKKSANGLMCEMYDFVQYCYGVVSGCTNYQRPNYTTVSVIAQPLLIFRPEQYTF